MNYRSYFSRQSGIFLGCLSGPVSKPGWDDEIEIAGRFSRYYRVYDVNNPVPVLIPVDEILVISRNEIKYCFDGEPGNGDDRWLGIKNLAVKVADGNVFDFDESSWQLMRETVDKFDYLDSWGRLSHHQWKLAGARGFVAVDKITLRNYLKECEEARALNVEKAFPEYQFYKKEFDEGRPPKLVDLQVWKKSYEVVD